MAAGVKKKQSSRVREQDQAAISMLITLLRAYYWLDDSVRNYVESRGAPQFTRAQGMVMANIILGLHHPSEIARQLSVSRQAIHTTLRQMVRKGIVRLVKDPKNSRIRLAHLTEFGLKMRYDGLDGMRIIVEELEQRVGKAKVNQLSAVLDADWGPTMTFSPNQNYTKGYRTAKK